MSIALRLPLGSRALCSARHRSCTVMHERQHFARFADGTSAAMRRGMDRRALMMLSALMLSLLCQGCVSVATIHQAYAPLLHRAGQTDLSIRGGLRVPGGAGGAINVAHAPVDHFEIVGGIDAAGGSGPYHVGVTAGVGTFVRDDVLRLELMAGTAAGWMGSELQLRSCFFSFSSCTPQSADIQGYYLGPFVQGMIGFELSSFVFAAGARLHGYLSDTRLVRDDSSELAQFDTNRRLYVEPVLTARFGGERVHFEVLISYGVPIVGDSDVHGRPDDFRHQISAGFGIGFHFDDERAQ